MPSGVSTRSAARDHINTRREEHGAQPIQSIGDDYTEGIEFGDEITVDPLQSEGTVSLLNRVSGKIKDRRDEFLDEFDKLTEYVTKLEGEEDLERSLNTLDLVDRGLSLLEEYDGECPLCLTDWSDDELQIHLERRKERATHLKSLKEDLVSAYENLNDLLVEHTDDIDRLQSELKDDYPEAASEIRGVIETATAWRQNLNQGSLTELPAKSGTREAVFPDSLIEEISELVELANEKPEVKSSIKNVDALARADDRYQELVEREQVLDNVEETLEILESIEGHFLNARNRVLTEAFEDICERFEEYYQQMHRDEEAADFSAILEPTKTGVKFEPKFYDQGHHHPMAVHSEGHRDSMGLALFLAMSDVGGEAIDILLLDDVMMSIDSGHRSDLADMLAGEISDRYQILLTTHDKTWDRHLHLTNEFEKQVRFSKCSLEGGPLPVENLSDPWERIEYLIKHDDVTSAAAWIRKTVEWYSRRTCANLEAEVPYHELENENLGIGRLFQSALREYRDLLEQGDAIEETEYSQSLYSPEDVQEDLDILQEVMQDTDRHLNLLHRNVHHNDPEAAFYTGEELKNENEVFKQAFDLFYCSDCNSWVKKGDNVYCDCTIRVSS